MAIKKIKITKFSNTCTYTFTHWNESPSLFSLKHHVQEKYTPFYQEKYTPHKKKNHIFKTHKSFILLFVVIMRISWSPNSKSMSQRNGQKNHKKPRNACHVWIMLEDIQAISVLFVVKSGCLVFFLRILIILNRPFIVFHFFIFIFY